MRPSISSSAGTFAWIVHARFGIICAGVSLLLSASALAGDPPVRPGLKVGDPSPVFSDFALVPNTLPPTNGKVVLLDFWASWCAPCKASFPAYSRIDQEFRDAGLVIIAVGVDDKLAAHNAFVEKLKPTFEIVHDSTKSLVKAVNVKSMPTAYLIGRDGKVRSIHVGFFGRKTEVDLRNEIQSLLKEQPPVP
jgi:thiol-disulfide isomerase/thioredoxin